MIDPIESIIVRLRRHAYSGVWEGCRRTAYFDRCRVVDVALGLSCIFTRDIGHHTSGWWKNPDYERCLHLSVSFFDPETGEPAPRNEGLTRQLIAGLFGRCRRWIWTEPPYSAAGKRKGVWHYRLFCDPGWRPIKPRGEVYNRELTEAGWLSWSDLQAYLWAQRERGVLLPKPPARNNPRLCLA